MTKLQKSAWINLAGVTFIVIMLTACVFYLAHMNAQGIVYLVVCVVVPILLSPWLYIYHRRKSLESSFDEREAMIYRRAFIVSAFGLAVFLAYACILPFFLLGGQNVIKVYYLPLIFVGALFAAQFVHSAAILVMCALEDDDG